MRSWLSSVFAGRDKPPAYRLQENWEPSLEDELTLAVASFLADDAFHSAFGEGRRLAERALLWHFLGLIINRRRSPSNSLITVCTEGTIKGLISGSLNTAPSIWKIIRTGYRDELTLSTVKSAKGEARREIYRKGVAEMYDAVADEQLEVRLKAYFHLIHAHHEQHPAKTGQFFVTVIAVDPTESGRGHLKAMLGRLDDNLRKKKIADSIVVTTYDTSKVSLYEHLGFTTEAELKNDDLRAWVLKRPVA